MLQLVTTGQFRKDYRRVKKRGYNMDLLEEVIDLLLNEQTLNERYRDHGLVVYAPDKEKLILTASRTGTHSDLFVK